MLEESVRYMDDGRAWLHPIRAGWRWTGGALEFSEEWEREDMSLSPTERTKRVMAGTMEGIEDFLEFTMETGEDFVDVWLPTLDTSMRVREDNMVEYRFFEKPMSSNMVLHKDTAMAENPKIRCLSNDLKRRMLTTSELVDNKVRNEIVDRYAQKLTNSGYGLEQVRRIIVGGLKGYERKLAESRREGGNSTRVRETVE